MSRFSRWWHFVVLAHWERTERYPGRPITRTCQCGKVWVGE